MHPIKFISILVISILIGFGLAKTIMYIFPNENPCTQLLISYDIITVGKIEGGEIGIEIHKVGEKEVGSVIVSSTTPKTILDKVKVGKKLNVCYVIQ